MNPDRGDREIARDLGVVHHQFVGKTSKSMEVAAASMTSLAAVATRAPGTSFGAQPDREAQAHPGAASAGRPWRHCPQLALRRRWRRHVQERLCARLQGHCTEAARLAVPFRPSRSLAKDQEPACASGDARLGRGTGKEMKQSAITARVVPWEAPATWGVAIDIENDRAIAYEVGAKSVAEIECRRVE